MSSVSSALTSLASVSTMDFVRHLAGGRRSEEYYLRFSKYSTVFWAVALINHNRDIGMYTPGQLVVLGLRQAVEYYEGDPKQAELKPAAQPTPRDLAIEKDCAALYQVADDRSPARG